MWITADGGGLRFGKMRCVFTIGHFYNKIDKKTSGNLK